MTSGVTGKAAADPESGGTVQDRPRSSGTEALREASAGRGVQERPRLGTKNRPAPHRYTTQLIPLASNPGFYLFREAAELLRVSRATVYALLGRGEVGHTRVSNGIRIPREELVAYLTRH